MRVMATLRDSWHRARATVVVGELLDRGGASKAGKLYHATIERAWQACPARLNGTTGARPEHEVIALFATALAVHRDSFGAPATGRLRQALAAGIGTSGRYQPRLKDWRETAAADLMAFARAVLREAPKIEEPAAG